MASPRAFVTGATGFIGSHLCDLLCRRGYEVAALSRRTSDCRWLAGLPVQRVEADLADAPSLRSAVDRAEMVFHVAGLTRAHGRREYHAGNQRTTRNLLAAARDVGTVRRFVYVSSFAAAGPALPGRPAVETDRPHPITFYGTSKLAAEREVLRFGDSFEVTIIRPPAVYGPRDVNMVAVFRSAARGVFLLPTGGRATVSLVHVADLVEALRLAADAPEAVGETYYVSGQVTTWRDVGRLLEAALDRPLKYVNVPPLFLRLAGELGELKWLITGRPQIMCRRKVKDILQPSWACSNAKIREELGYSPQTGLREGLAETLRWYRERGWV